MGYKVATLWHASFSIGAGVLYFYFVLPRWPELIGETTHTLGTTLRIVTGVLFGLAALPVVFTLLRSQTSELGIPQLALSIRTWSIVAHVLSGVLIVSTAIGEIWLSSDTAVQCLFGIYGAAAASAVLGFVAFYLSFVAALPPPSPKPVKLKKANQRRIRRRKGRKDNEAEDEEADAGEHNEAETPAQAEEVTSENPQPAPESGAQKEPDELLANKTEETDEPRRGLHNRRPTGKVSHQRRRARSGIAVEN
ncbi:hypothetical protein JK2ML_2337 [Mycobacterium leprae Kyoto-2]|uniref:Membrane protein n=3 Tax=Mycobacterium leprae TaxID=1769 RepID=Q7APW1_MYCLE|nr:hypothetical protein [Mycobacterium leprae]CAR72435.1 putative membrane protein [Mycobacterium leprae Br4923]AWV48624.1 hypothetical protein DIJ64_12830 [Mycobacterium leprae]OAR21116.1 hypothetical protein A8144_01230 [Mycobacterium leprae 3125609]OAX72114.1 hypothetical protein A3216_01305 [Mycobacterium leprae 7935681]CAA19153.1 hypothetical protein MLCB2407.13c [Mycobacterium leprae]